MNVYIARADADQYQALRAVREADLDRLLDGFKGVPMADVWTPIPVETRVVEAPDAARTPSDFPSFGARPAFSAHAIEELADLLEGRGELLPLLSSDGEYYAFNVLRLVDALDEDGSTIERFDDGRIMHIDNYEFFADRLAGETIFKLAPAPDAYEFVTDVFVDRVRERKLTGFLFQNIWTGQTPSAART